jgi:hypothetical protein
MSNIATYNHYIKNLKASYSKVAVSLLYAPLVQWYYDYIGVLERAQAEDGVVPLLEAMDEFPHEGVKDLVHENITTLSSNLIVENTDFYNSYYPELVPIARRYQPGSKHVHKLRNKLFSFFRLINNDLSGMRNEWVQIERRLERINDSGSSLRNGLSGGAIGATLGSIVPGVGTVVGSFLGGYLMNKHKENSEIEKILESTSKYAHRVDSLMGNLADNSEELYGIFESVAEYIYKTVPKQIYNSIDGNKYNKDKIIKEFYMYEQEAIIDIYNSNIDPEDPDSLTYREMVSFVKNL